MIKSGKDILVISVTTVVVAAVIAGLLLLGSPALERMRKLDEQRISDLRAVANAVDRYTNQHNNMPTSLDELSKERGIHIKLIDPETSHPYEYKITGENSYELCASFSHSSAEDQDQSNEQFWSHNLGRHCFQLEAKCDSK